MSERFAALHVHSSWSFQDSLIKPELAAAKAKEYGYVGLAITDHGNVAGLTEHYDACKKNGIIPILGSEFYIVEDCQLEQSREKKEKIDRQKSEHITVYAINSTGVRNLYKLSSISFLEGFYYRPRIDYKTLFKYQDGLIVNSGCLKNRISQAIVKLLPDGKFQEDIYLATKIARWMKDNLGDKYYLEMMPHDIPEQVLLNSYLYTISRKLDIPLVVSMDAHYIDHSEAADQDILMAASMHKKEGEEDKRPKLRTATYHLMPIEEIMDLFKKTHPTIPIKAVHKAFENTAKIADMVVDIEEDPLIKYKQDLFPDYCKTPKEGLKLFNDLIEKGWFEKLDAGLIPKDKEELYWDRIKKEKTQIIRTHMENYFLVVWDLIRYAVEKEIPHGVGRGTVGSSMIAWMMGITGVDPIKHKLIFERFINPYRTDLPDIDMDFCYDRRKEITDYIITKYGVDNVCQIATYAKRSTKLALKDVGRALQMDFGVMNWIAKQVEWDEFDTLELAIANSPDAKAMQKKFPNLFEKALKLQGTYRQFGRHPAGVIMSKIPLVEVVPLKNTKEDDEDDSGIKTVAQYDMNVLKKIGLIKLDVLGLRTCTIMADVLRNIKSIYGEDVDLEKLPLEDKPTFEMLTEGDLAGVFQVEKSTGLRRLLIKIGIHKFSEIHDMIALYRPGPLKQGMAEIYIENKAKTMEGEKLRYHEIDAVHEIIKETYGTCIPVDSYVYVKGKRKFAKEVVVGNMIASMKGESLVEDVVLKGRRKIVNVSLLDGNQIECTPDHRVMTQRGWVEAGLLRVNKDSVLCRFLVNHSNVLDAKEKAKSEFLGLILSDGAIRSNVTFFNKEEKLLKKFSRCCKVLWPKIVLKRSVHKNGVVRIRCSKNKEKGSKYHVPNQAKGWIKEIGLLGTNSETKFVPDFVFSFSDEGVKCFLKAIWAGDGCLGNNLISYRSQSLELLKGVKELLWKVGIPSLLSMRGKCMTLYVRDHLRFEKVLGLKGNSSRKNVNYDLVSGEFFRKSLLELKGGMSERCFQREFRVRRGDLRKQSKFCSAQKLYDLGILKKRENCWHVPVLNVKSMGEKDVLDFQTSSGEFLSTGGVVVHNCLYQEQIMEMLHGAAGLDYGVADTFRKIMDDLKMKGKEEKVAKYQEQFIEGCQKHSKLTLKESKDLWKTVEGFTGYTFPRAHCLHPMTRVYNADLKKYTAIKYIKPGTHVLTFDKSGRIIRSKVVKVFKSSKKKMYKLCTKTGRELIASADHKILTPSGMVRLKELLPGMSVISFKNQCLCGCGIEITGDWNRGHVARVKKSEGRIENLTSFSKGNIPWNVGLTYEVPKMRGLKNPAWDTSLERNEHCLFCSKGLKDKRNKFCSYECCSKHNVGPCHPMFGKKQSHFSIETSRKHAIQVLTKGSKQKDTYIERLLESELEKHNINFEKQREFGGITRVDFYIPSLKRVVYCDGLFYHSMPKAIERRKRQRNYFKANDIQVVELTSKEIMSNPKQAALRCLNGIYSSFKDEIISVDYEGEHKSFDLQVDHPSHNFVAQDVFVSNSVEYGMITYFMAYLKCHYFKAFLLSMFNSTDKDIERVKRFVLLARQRGVKIRLPFINEADVRFKYDDKGRIVWSFQDIKGMGESAIPEILEKRPFNSLEDMLKRVTKKNCNKKSIQTLFKAGSFSQWDFDESRNTYNKHYDDTFDKDFQGTFLDLEREALGIHLTESPMTRHIELLQGVRRLSDMEDVPEGSTDLFAGVIDKLSIKKSKKDSSEFAIVEVEDESYTKVPLFVFGKAYNKYRDRLIEGTVLKFQAEKTQDRLKINSDKLLLLNLDRQNNERGG